MSIFPHAAVAFVFAAVAFLVATIPTKGRGARYVPLAVIQVGLLAAVVLLVLGWAR